MDTIIATASTTFNTSVGFGLGAVRDWVFDQALVILGFGLYIFQTLLPVILVFAGISIGVYLVYRVLKWAHIF